MVVMVNYLAAGYARRFQMDRNSPVELSEETRRVLDGLTNDVNITIFFEPHGPNEDIYTLTSDLLTEYALACPRHIHVKTLDYGRDVGAAKEFLARHSLGAGQDKDRVVFDCGAASKTVDARYLAKLDFSDLLSAEAAWCGAAPFSENYILLEA